MNLWNLKILGMLLSKACNDNKKMGEYKETQIKITDKRLHKAATDCNSFINNSAAWMSKLEFHNIKAAIIG